MRTIFNISLLMLCFSLSAQFSITDGNGKTLSLNGSLIKGPAALSYIDSPPPESKIYIAIVGNSIAGGTYDSLLIENPGQFEIYSFANPGDELPDQEALFADMEATNPAKIDSFDYICIAPCGVNDVAQGDNDLSQATIENRYNSLITTIKNAISPTAKIVLSAMTPAKGSQYVSDAESDKLVSINNNFIAPGPSNVDIVFMTNYFDMVDGSGYMDLWYNSGDSIHPGWYGRKAMRENLLEAIGYLSTFDGIIYKQVTFSEIASVPRQNTTDDARTYLGSSDINRWDLDSAYADSTVIIVNDQGYTDSVWQVRITHMPDGSNESSGGVSWVGRMFLNGVNAVDDTLTWFEFYYYTWYGPDFDFIESRGGKLPGIAGTDLDGGTPPGNGQHLCDCPEPFPSGYDPYCSDDGFSIRGGFDYSYSDVGVYAYIRQMTDNLNCVSKTYAYTWNQGRITETGLPWELEKWYKICLRVDLGSAGSSNGYIQMARNDTIIWSRPNINIRGNSGIYADSWWLTNFAGGDPTDNFDGMWIRHDDFTLVQGTRRSPYNVGEVMTNTPPMATPNAN